MNLTLHHITSHWNSYVPPFPVILITSKSIPRFLVWLLVSRAVKFWGPHLSPKNRPTATGDPSSPQWLSAVQVSEQEGWCYQWSKWDQMLHVYPMCDVLGINPRLEAVWWQMLVNMCKYTLHFCLYTSHSHLLHILHMLYIYRIYI